MYYYEQNPILQNEILIYNDENIIASLNKANFDTDEDCTKEALKICNSLNR
jgi:hypothetical protein